MSMKERLHTGELYLPDDEEIGERGKEYYFKNRKIDKDLLE